MLKRAISREVVAAGVKLIVTLTPDGHLVGRAKYRRRRYDVDLAQRFPHCVAERGGESVEQLTLSSLVTPAAPATDPDRYTRGSEALPATPQHEACAAPVPSLSDPGRPDVAAGDAQQLTQGGTER